MHNIGGVFDRLRHDSSSMQYIDKESRQRLSETPAILRIENVNITEWGGLFGLIIRSASVLYACI